MQIPCRKSQGNLKNALALSFLLKGSACDQSKFSSWCPLTDSEVRNPNLDFQFFLADLLQKKSRNLKIALALSFLLKGSACDHSKFSSWCPFVRSQHCSDFYITHSVVSVNTHSYVCCIQCYVCRHTCPCLLTHISHPRNRIWSQSGIYSITQILLFDEYF